MQKLGKARKAHRANNIRENCKRKQRLQALEALETSKQSKAIRLNLHSRVELFEAQFDARPVKALQFDPVNLYCNKTGAKLGQVDQSAVAIMVNVFDELDNPNARQRTANTYTNNYCHPAWFNTSHDNLAILQRLMPHEYVVYTRNLLLKTNVIADERFIELTILYDESPNALVIEYAELLRRALAMFGKYASKCKVLPDLPYLNVSASIENLKQWITQSIRKVQKQLHHEEIDRRKVVTLSDIKNFQFDLGCKLFREARIDAANDDALLIDVAEIFAESIVAEQDGMSTAWTYYPPAKAAKEPAFDGKASGQPISTGSTAIDGTVTTNAGIRPIGLF